MDRRERTGIKKNDPEILFITYLFAAIIAIELPRVHCLKANRIMKPGKVQRTPKRSNYEEEGEEEHQ